MKQMKKMLIMLLVFAVAVSMVSASAFATGSSFEVEAVNVSGAAGEDVVMTVRVNSNPGVVAAILNIQYDSTKLTLNSVTDVNFINDATEMNIGTGECTVVLDNALATADVTTTGDLLSLNFTVAEGVSGDVAVDLTVKEAVNYNLETVAVNAVDGKISVNVGPSIDDVDISRLPEGALPEGGIGFNGNTMTIAPAADTPACVVLIRNGDSYTKVNAVKNGDKYDFDVSALNGGEIVIAVKGDASGDGKMDVTDVLACMNGYTGSGDVLNSLQTLVADTDASNTVDVTDVLALMYAYTGTALEW